MARMPIEIRRMIITLFNIGYEPWQIERGLKGILREHGIYSAEYVSDYIRFSRYRGAIKRMPKTGRARNEDKHLAVPKEVFMAGVVRLKNRMTGEVKLIPMEQVHTYRKWGWIDASLKDFRNWHLKKSQLKGYDRTPPQEE